MKQFKDFNIKPTSQSFVGDKIKMARILNKAVEVHDYRITDSKFEGKGKRLDMQIKVENEMRVVFTSGKSLITDIEQIPKQELPFTVTIVKQNDQLLFT